MSDPETNRELVIIQKSFDYILDNLLSTEKVEIPFPDQQKYPLKKVLQNCKELAYKGFYKKSYEQLLFTIGYLFAHFGIVQERVQKDYESMLKIIDVKTARIREIEASVKNEGNQIKPYQEELDNIQTQIRDNLEKLEYIEDIFKFSRDRVDEFSDFVRALDTKRVDPIAVRQVLLKEMNSVQQLILAKYETKFYAQKEKPVRGGSKPKESVAQSVKDNVADNTDDEGDTTSDEETDGKDELSEENTIKGKERDFLRRTKNG